MVTTDRHGLCRPILMKFSSTGLFITFDGKYDGPSYAQRSLEDLSSKTLQLFEYGYWDYFSELHDEPAGRTVIDTTDRQKLRNPHLVILPHLPSAVALRCHLRSVTSTKGLLDTQILRKINNTVKPRYINTLNLNSLFFLKRHTINKHNTLYKSIIF